MTNPPVDIPDTRKTLDQTAFGYLQRYRETNGFTQAVPEVVQAAAERDDFAPVRRLAVGLCNALAFVVVIAAFVAVYVAMPS